MIGKSCETEREIFQWFKILEIHALEGVTLGSNSQPAKMWKRVRNNIKLLACEPITANICHLQRQTAIKRKKEMSE